MIYIILNNIRYYASRIFIVLVNVTLVYIAFHISHFHVKIGEHNIYSLLYPYDRKIEWWFYVLVFIILLSVINVFILFLLSIYFNFRMNRNQAVRARYESIITDNIIRYLYSDPLKDSGSEEEYCLILRSCLKTKRLMEIFFSVMIRIQEMVDEDLSVRYNNLIGNLKLKRSILSFLYSRKLSEKIISLKVISCLKLRGSERIISRYSISSNYVLRIAALETLIKLSETDHLNVLLSHEKLISKLDINVIINGIEKNRKADIDYLSLIRSELPRISVTGLFLIKSRNKSELKEFIKPFLENNDSMLRSAAWEVFTYFAGTEEDLDLMRQRYNNELLHIRTLIVRSIRSFSQSDKVLDFLDEIIKKDNLLLKIEALKLLFEKNADRFMSYRASGDRSIDSAYNEIVDLNL